MTRRFIFLWALCLTLPVASMVLAWQQPMSPARVVLLNGAATRAVTELPVIRSGVPESISITFDLLIDPASGPEGVGLLLADPVQHPHKSGIAGMDAAEEPNVSGVVSIGFDTSNPPPADPNSREGMTDAAGNIYDRPQREISVHVEGVELLNRAAPDFAINRPVPVEAALQFVAGGAELTLSVGGVLVYDRQLLPGVRPFEPRFLLAARGADGARAEAQNVRVALGPKLTTPFAEPTRVTLFDRANVGSLQREAVAIVDFSAVPARTARIIATLRIDAPPGGMDPQARRGALYLTTPTRQRFEILRFITAFNRPYEWKADVTDFLPLLRDQQTLSLMIDGWAKGFATTVTLDFYPGMPERTPIGVANLWQGEPILGDAQMPVNDFFDIKTVLVPREARSAKLRVMVTGHGQSPNSRNAAEFLPMKRTLVVNQQQFTSTLWKADNYLNPCRPQAGTWKFDRAGWAPGSVVTPWEIDLRDMLKAAPRELTLSYELEPYSNESPGQADPPTHWVESQVIFYDR